MNQQAILANLRLGTTLEASNPAVAPFSNRFGNQIYTYAIHRDGKICLPQNGSSSGNAIDDGVIIVINKEPKAGQKVKITGLAANNAKGEVV